MRDAQTLYATISPRKSFGLSAFGPLQFRPIQDDGTKGDWQPLATLVRVPTLKEIRCPESTDKPCQLTGNNLFLIDSVASDQQFTHNAPVPTDFIDSTLSVPHPGDGGLFIKLRDDPSSVNTVTLPVAKLPEPPSSCSRRRRQLPSLRSLRNRRRTLRSVTGSPTRCQHPNLQR